MTKLRKSDNIIPVLRENARYEEPNKVSLETVLKLAPDIATYIDDLLPRMYDRQEALRYAFKMVIYCKQPENLIKLSRLRFIDEYLRIKYQVLEKKPNK